MYSSSIHPSTNTDMNLRSDVINQCVHLLSDIARYKSCKIRRIFSSTSFISLRSQTGKKFSRTFFRWVHTWIHTRTAFFWAALTAPSSPLCCSTLGGQQGLREGAHGVSRSNTTTSMMFPDVQWHIFKRYISQPALSYYPSSKQLGRT